MLAHKDIAQNAIEIMLLNASVNTRGTEHMGMDLEHGLYINALLYVCRMKAS